MSVNVTITHRNKAARAANPSPRQRLRRELWEFVDAEVDALGIDRDEYNLCMVDPDDAFLGSVRKDDSGRVQVEVVFVNTLTFTLDELPVTTAAKARIATLLGELEQLTFSTNKTDPAAGPAEG